VIFGFRRVPARRPARRGRVRRVVASGLAWTVGATAAVAVGLIALSLIGPGLGVRPLDSLATDPGGQPVAQDLPTSAVPVPSASRPAASGRQTPKPGTTPNPGTSISATRSDPSPSADMARLLSSPGGNVFAQCTAGGAYLVSWSPAQGYRIGDVRRGPAAVAHVAFSSRRDVVTVWVDCFSGGLPQGHIDVGPPPPGGGGDD